ncbi:Breast cancer 2, early onset [Actinomortierella ambigua]|nr:Breast cancer 2, early onset [Actinomortierella ambigua]
MDSTTAQASPPALPLDSHVMLVTCPLENQHHPTLIATLHASNFDTSRHQSALASQGRQRPLHGAWKQRSRWALLPAHFQSQLESKATKLRAQIKPSGEDTIDQSNRDVGSFEGASTDAPIDTRWRLRNVDPLYTASSQPLAERAPGEFRLHRRQSHDATVGFRSRPSSPSLKTGCARGSTASLRRTAELTRHVESGVDQRERDHRSLNAGNTSGDLDMLDEDTMVESRRTSSNFQQDRQLEQLPYNLNSDHFSGKGKDKVSPFRRARSVADIYSSNLMKTPPRPTAAPRITRTSSDLGLGRLTVSSPMEETRSDPSDSPGSGKACLFDILTRKAPSDLQSPGSKSDGEGIAWSSSLETPPRPLKSTTINGGVVSGFAMKTPVQNMLSRTGEDTDDVTQLLEDEIEGDVIEWSSALETPPKKRSSPSKRASDAHVTPSSRKARVIDHLRGVPSRSPSTQERQRWIGLQSGITAAQPLSLNDMPGHTDATTTPLTDRAMMVREWSPIIDSGDDDHTTIVDIDMRMHSSDTDPSPPEMSLPAPPSMSVNGLTLPSSLIKDMGRSLPIMTSPNSDRSSLPSHSATLEHIPLDPPRAGTAVEQDSNDTELSSQDRHIMARFNNASGFSGGFGSLSGKTFKVSKQALQAAERLLQQDEDTDMKPNETDAPIRDAPKDAESDDDFGNLRVSQLDDGLTMLSDSTQGRSSQTQHQQNGVLSSRRQSLPTNRRKSQSKHAASSQKSGQSGDHDDDSLWLSTNAHLLGDMGALDESVEYENGGEGDDTGFLASSAAAPEGPTTTLGGFSTGKGKPLKPVSKETMEKWSSFFDNDPDNTLPHLPPPNSSTATAARPTHPVPPVMSGFTTGSGKKTIAISEDKLQTWASIFEDDSSSTSARGAGTERQDNTSGPPSFSQATRFSGFSNGAGKKLMQPISKEAQEKARQLLEMDDNPLPAMAGQPPSIPPATVGFGRPSLGSTSTSHGKTLKRVLGSNLPRQASGIASLRRTMGASSRLTSISGSKAAPMKAKLPFKPPSMSTEGASSSWSLASSSSTFASKPKPLGAGAEPMAPLATNVALGNTPGVHHPPLAPPQKQHRRTSNNHRVLHPNAKQPQTDAVHTSVNLAAETITKQPGKLAVAEVFNMTSKEPRRPLSTLYRKPLALEREELLELGIHQDIVNMTLESAKTFQFSGGWGIAQARQEMIQRGGSSIHEQYISEPWITNHYALIVWKLACYVRSWPVEFEDWFCPDKVVEQLLYRYEREVNRAERPVLRKVVEGDESSQRHMVLCIADLQWDTWLPPQQQEQSGSAALSTAVPQKVARVKVTDGWYVLPAAVDAVLHRALENGKVRIGSKIGVCRAKIDGVEGGVGIFEVSDNVLLRLHANSTRLVSWDTRLGLQRSPLWWTRLGSISQHGGMVPGIDVVVLRKYPLQFLESMPDGTWVKRTRQEEHQAEERHRENLQRQLHDYAQQLEKEQQQNYRENVGAMEEKLAQKAQELRTDRHVKPMFVLRVATCTTVDGERDSRQGVLTFWNDSHEAYEEGHRYRFTPVMAKRGGGNNGMHSSVDDVVYLTADRSTTSRAMPVDQEAAVRSGYTPRTITLIDNIDNSCSEIDLAVIVIAHGSPTPSSGKPFAIVTDVTRRLLLVECPPTSNGKLPSWMKVNAKILLTGAKFKLWDSMLQMPVVSYVNGYTQVTYGGTWTAPVNQQQQQHLPTLAEGSVGRHMAPRHRTTVTTAIATHSENQPLSTGTIIGGSRMSWPSFAQPAWETLDVLFEDYASTPRPHRPRHPQQASLSLTDLTVRANELLVRLMPDM